MKPQGNDKFPDSAKPYRSQRFSLPETITVANNRFDIIVRRGTWRLQAIQVYTSDVFQNGIVFVAVSRSPAIEVFPAGVTWLTAKGEVLPPYTYYFGATAKVHSFSPGYPVELDVLDGERIVAWDAGNVCVIKYVQVGELPPRDAEVSDRER